METILVVDDDAAVRRFIADTLRDAGFAVMATGRAEQALSLVEGRTPGVDLAVIDMAMPVMSGLDLAAILEREHEEIKILFISGHGDSIAMESIFHKSPQQVLLKPFNETAIAHRVEQLLRRPVRPNGGESAN